MFSPSDVSMSSSSDQITFTWAKNLGFATRTKIVWMSGDLPPADCNSGTLFYEGEESTASLGGFSVGTYSFRLCASDGAGNYSQGITFSNYAH